MMQIDPKTHLLSDAEYIASPNCDDRPGDSSIELIVVHSISLPPGEYGGDWIPQLFCNTLPAEAHPYFKEIHTLEVSAHVLIRRDGRLIQFVPFDKRAWHAGASCWRGRERCNDFSIGIELEGTDTDVFEAVQYERLAELVNALRSCYPTLKVDAISGHSDIAPERKTDPGAGFSWDTLNRLIA
jgi:AmpD protein